MQNYAENGSVPIPEHQVITNPELGQAYFYWESKYGRLFLASQVMKELGYTGRANTLLNYDLIERVDSFKFSRKENKIMFDELVHLKCIGSRSGAVIMLSESGFWKLVMQSRKKVGVLTRNWLASEVLPSIRKSGQYNVMDMKNNPMAIFTERNKQLSMSKGVNAAIFKEGQDYSKFWNELHLLVVGMDAKGIKQLYNSKESAKEILRKQMPHLEATEAMIEDIWQQGIGLDKIKETGLHHSLSHSFNALISLGIDLKKLGK